MRELMQFRVLARPTPQGSLSSNGRGGLYHSNGVALKKYRDAVRMAAVEALPAGYQVTDRAVAVAVVFTYRSSDARKWGAPKTTMADLDRLVRAVGDALTGTIYVDDAQIVTWAAAKLWSAADETIVRIRVA